MHPHAMRALCVDDDEDTLLMLSTLLGLVGFEVTTAATMQEGLDRIRGERFSLFIFDYWLPGGSGIDLCRTVRASGDETPILFYTAAGYASEIREATDAGAQSYLIKPSDVGRLTETALGLVRDGTKRD